jgi:hypothetical protein
MRQAPIGPSFKVRLSFAPATVRIEFVKPDAHHKRRQAASRRCPVLGGEQTCWADGHRPDDRLRPWLTSKPPATYYFPITLQQRLLGL